jgi:hypothetical protein
MKLARFAITACAVPLLALAAFSAQAATGLYIGGGVGQSQIEDTPTALGGAKFDEKDNAWKAFLGLHIDAIPIVKLAAEIGWRDLGNPEISVLGVPVRYELDGYDYAALAGVGIGPVDLFARYGRMKYSLAKTFGPVREEFDDWAPIIGASAWLSIGKAALRVDYEEIDVPQLDTTRMATINLLVKF